MQRNVLKQPQSLLDLIGNTPLIELKGISSNPKVKIYAKLEGFNPGGSVKDRVALAMIEEAEKNGELTKDKIVIEATSGNTGIGLALVCAYKGYKLTLLMPESASEERKKILKAYGANLVLTPANLSTDGAIEEAYRLVREEPEKYVLMDQFNNPASIKAHYETTGKEIWEQTEGKVTHFVAALGTSGTAMGTTKRLKELNPEIVCVGVEPKPGHKIQGLKNMQESYPPGIYDPSKLDKVLKVDDEEAFALCRKLAKEQGLLVGMSSGAALAGALKLAQDLKEGLIVVIFPDGGERYLSTSLFYLESSPAFSLNSLTGAKVELNHREIDLFTFGPSLDQIEELGFWRRIVFLDVISRYLKSVGIKVKLLVGVADFEDRTLSLCRSLGIKREKLKERAKEKLDRISNLFNIEDIQYVFASDVLDSSIALCDYLLLKGKAYEKLRSVYFDISREEDYGKLVIKNTKLKLSQSGLGVYYIKDNPSDFTLLKRASLQDLKEGEVLKTKWGNVRPSWYLQQASIVLAKSKNPYLVFCGSEHLFPHVDNLQSLWVNSVKGAPLGWINVSGVKSELLNPSREDFWILRSIFLATSLSKTLQLREHTLQMWRKNWGKITDSWVKLNMFEIRPGNKTLEVESYYSKLKEKIKDYLENNFQLVKIWPELFAFLKFMNKKLSQSNLTSGDEKIFREFFKWVEDILGLKLLQETEFPKEVEQLIVKRKEAKKNKDYQVADKIREELKKMGYRIIDLGEDKQIVTRMN